MPHASNWAVCPRERWLVGNDLTTYEPVPVHIKERGTMAEELVRERIGGHHRETPITLPNGRAARYDMLNREGEVVEVKALSPGPYSRIHSLKDWTGEGGSKAYTYQMQYLVQLAGYCVTLQTDGWLYVVNADMPGQEMKSFRMTLAQATQIWDLFVNDQLRPISCDYCKVAQSCKCASKLLGWKPGYELPLALAQ